ncbi:unnamed protein product [Peronospora belbahrii]|uniref:Uncharacterized protein n=1 Tax=Peronospora belbahrii TaxID=622444 RepID=A0ABN8CU84_9STRA|nr:unnamed protein product [Peronospora belbahrii]
MDEIGYNGDGSVADDVRDALDDALCNDVAANFALFGRFDTQWIVHAQVDDLSFSGTAGARRYPFFCLQSTWHPSNRQAPALRVLCLVFMYNFPALLYHALDQGALIAYSAKVHQHHEWILNLCDSHLSHFDMGMADSIEEVHSMLACDRATFLSNRVAVRSGAYSAFHTFLAQLLAGSTLWWL